MARLASAGKDWLRRAKPWFIPAVLFLALAMAACKVEVSVGTHSEAEEHLNRARQLMMEPRWQEAIDKLDEAIELDPDLAEAYANRGTAHSELGQFEHALADLDQAIELSPTTGGFYTNRGRVYGLMGKPAEALADYDRALELNEEDHLAYLNRGAIYADYQGDFRKAKASYDKAIELEPEFAQAYFNRGTAQFNLGQHKQAVVDLNKAIELGLEPGVQGLAYNERGRAYLALDDYGKALSDFEMALQFDPSLDFVYANRGLAHARLGDTEQAIADLEHVLSVSQDPVLRSQVESFLDELGAE